MNITETEIEELNNAIKVIKKYCKNDYSGENGGFENCENCILKKQCVKSFNEWELIKHEQNRQKNAD